MKEKFNNPIRRKIFLCELNSFSVQLQTTSISIIHISHTNANSLNIYVNTFIIIVPIHLPKQEYMRMRVCRIDK